MPKNILKSERTHTHTEGLQNEKLSLQLQKNNNNKTLVNETKAYGENVEKTAATTTPTTTMSR